MRIAFLHPTYWPEVRRGSERLLHELATGLAGRGHDVEILTTHPGPSTVTIEEGVRVRRARRPPALRPLRWYEDFIATVPINGWRLFRRRYDIAHALFPSDALAAALARERLGGPPLVFSLHGIPTRKYLVERRYRIEQLKRSIGAASVTTVLSEAARDAVRRYLLHDPLVVPGAVALERWAVEEPSASRPTVLCASTLADPRKGGALLLEAFALLRRQLPDAELVLAGGRDHLGADRLPTTEGVRREQPADTEALARLYARAGACVLPAADEAFGLVLLESLAAGTPVVAARSGGAAEIVGSGAGELFEPGDAADLARALEAALKLRALKGTREACMSRAADYALPGLLDRWEEIYAELRAGGR